MKIFYKKQNREKIPHTKKNFTKVLNFGKVKAL
jgi:hypothetical protein